MQRRRKHPRKPIGRRDPRLLRLTEAEIDERVRGLLELRERLRRLRIARPGRGQPPVCEKRELPGLLNLACLVELAYLKAQVRDEAQRRCNRTGHARLASTFLREWRVWDQIPSPRALAKYRRAFSAGVGFREFFAWFVRPVDNAELANIRWVKVGALASKIAE
jgi:hypothetical protein